MTGLTNYMYKQTLNGCNGYDMIARMYVYLVEVKCDVCNNRV